VGYRVIEKWECEHDRETLPNYIAFTQHVREPLQLDDALFGGRVEVFKPSVQAGDALGAIRYLDICSLYPAVNKHDR
jgi:hypothetical protein